MISKLVASAHFFLDFDVVADVVIEIGDGITRNDFPSKLALSLAEFSLVSLMLFVISARSVLASCLGRAGRSGNTYSKN